VNQTTLRGVGRLEGGAAEGGTNIEIPVSAGELIDKITILRVKAERIGEPAKERNVRRELTLLEAVARTHLADTPELRSLALELAAVNARLWEIEEGKRRCELHQDFGPHFVELARAVYIQNDRRALIKRKINVVTGSDIVEEKSHPGVASDPGLAGF